MSRRPPRARGVRRFPPRRSRRVRAARAVLYGLAAAHLVEAALLRLERRRLAPLPPPRAAGSGVAAADPAPAGGAVLDDDEVGRTGRGEAAPDVDVLAVRGAQVGRATRAAAAEALADADVEAVDLVPGDLPADRALRLLRRVRVRRLAGDPLYAPGGAHEAVALGPGLAERMGVPPERSLDRGDLVRQTVRAQRYAPTGTAVRVAPALRAAPYGPRDRWREIEELNAFTGAHGSMAPGLVMLEALHLAALTAGVAVAPGAALAGLATWSAQPLLAFAGRTSSGVGGARLRPPDLLRASARRLPDAWRDTLRTGAAGWRAGRAAAAEQRRSTVPAPPPPTVLFEPRRDACAWCGSAELAGRLDTRDLLQHKPGAFHLDECTACGHIFQNPPLSPAGLDYYYEDCYEGVGADTWEHVFAAMGPAYERRAEAVGRFTEPRAWLDVGTGYGHFCLVARRRWPGTRFEGLDMSESVDEAERRGWVDVAHRGFFPDLAGGLAGRYDVVSMHHYLEHTRDPRQELAAAARVLRPGGYLMIETPDTASPWSHRLGRYWRCWFQPQHLHFVTHDNLVAELEGRGFDVVSSERGPATEGLDLSSAVYMAVDERLRSPDLPWLPRPPAAQRLGRLAALTAAAPLMAVAAASDTIKDARDRCPGTTTPGNAYRVIARRRPG